MITIINPTSNLPDGALINGVANFYTATKPLTRVDGSALVIGDLWQKPNGSRWFWNGTYWITSEPQIARLTVISTFGAGTYSVNPNDIDLTWGGLIFESLQINHTNTATIEWDVNNYTSFDVNIRPTDATTVTIKSFIVNDVTNSGVARTLTIDLEDYYFALSPQTVRSLEVSQTKVGSGTNTIGILYIIYRGVHA
jgi:hypothetical protein